MVIQALTTENIKEAYRCVTAMYDDIPKKKRSEHATKLQAIAMVLEAAAKAAIVLDMLRGYFIETTGEESPFVQRIDELVPRRSPENKNM